MTDTVMAAGLTAAAAVLCQIIISARASSLITYRVEMLEKKVDKLSQLTERICRVEEETRRTSEHITHISSSLPALRRTPLQ